jgi:hypothetical protein
MKISLIDRVIAMAFSWLCTFGCSFHPALVIGQKNPDEKGAKEIVTECDKNVTKCKKGPLCILCRINKLTPRN